VACASSYLWLGVVVIVLLKMKAKQKGLGDYVITGLFCVWVS
jgi:hypothetical protein